MRPTHLRGSLKGWPESRDVRRINTQDKDLDSFGPWETSSGNSHACCLWLGLIMLMRESSHKPALLIVSSLSDYFSVPLGVPCPSLYKLKGQVTCRV